MLTRICPNETRYRDVFLWRSRGVVSTLSANNSGQPFPIALLRHFFWRIAVPSRIFRILRTLLGLRFVISILFSSARLRERAIDSRQNSNAFKPINQNKKKTRARSSARRNFSAHSRPNWFRHWWSCLEALMAAGDEYLGQKLLRFSYLVRAYRRDNRVKLSISDACLENDGKMVDWIIANTNLGL